MVETVNWAGKKLPATVSDMDRNLWVPYPGSHTFGLSLFPAPYNRSCLDAGFQGLAHASIDPEYQKVVAYFCDEGGHSTLIFLGPNFEDLEHA